MGPSAKEYLYENVKKNHEQMISPVGAWINDESSSAHWFHAINKYFPVSTGF